MAKRKQKSKLLKLMKENEQATYVTTEDDCVLWFRILNREVFNNQLTPLSEIHIGWKRGTYGYYTKITDTSNPDYLYTKLSMNKKYRSKQFFVEVLAHELIHHYQAIYNQPLGHGPSFIMWRDKLNRKGINLTRVYVDDEAK